MDEQTAIDFAKQGHSVATLGISDHTYNDTDKLDSFLRSSDLKNAVESNFEHYCRTRRIPKPPHDETSALDAGHYIEDYVSGWTTKELDTKYFIFDKEERPDMEKTMAAKENKDWKARLLDEVEQAKKKVIDPTEIECLKWIDPTPAQSLLLEACKRADKQLTCLWTDPDTGVRLRSRKDYSLPDRNLIIDCKSTTANTLKKFMYQHRDLNMPQQALQQIEGARRTGYMSGPITYIWLGIAKKWPYNIYMVEYTQESQSRDFEHYYRTAVNRAAEYTALGGLMCEGEIFKY